jgi:hypothetical protein
MIERDVLEKLVSAGTFAPSIDNCQPWFFRLGSDFIHIILDEVRSDFFGDYGHAGSYVTIGAVIENIMTAAGHYGLVPAVSYFPSEKDSPVAVIKLKAGQPASSPLYPFIRERCTNRKPYSRKPLPENVMKRLVKTPRPQGAVLHLIDDRPVMKEISRLAAAVDRTSFEHKLLHQGLFKWIRWNAAEAAGGDGMPVGTLELNIMNRAAFRAMSSWPVMNLLNKFALSYAVGKVNSQLLLKASAIGFIVMDTSRPVDFLEGGRFFERVWLESASLGLSLQPFGGMSFLLTRLLQARESGYSDTQKKRLFSVYDGLRRIFPLDGKNGLIMLFRVGYGGKPSTRTSRRPLADVLQQG